MKSRFLSMVSHELRTPISLIVGLSQMLIHDRAVDDPAAQEQSRRDLERIHSSAMHLDGLIRDVLDLARSEAGRLSLACESLDLAEVLRPVVTVGEQMAQEAGLGWRAEIPGDLPQVWGDRTRLRQVALNLVSNAVKFTAKGEVALKVEVGWAADGKSHMADLRSPIADRVWRLADRTIPQAPSPESQTEPHASRFTHYAPDSQPPPCVSRFTHDAPVIVVSVTDTGLGIPPAEKATIFREFHQGEHTSARGYGGMGLGLAICRRLVELHGGSVWVSSSGEEGAGSTFTLTLPAIEYEDEAGLRPPPRERTILVLSGPAGGGEMGEHLVRQGFDVTTEEYGSGESARWLARIQAAPPGAVVLDAGLAAEEGWEALRLLKQNPATAGLPVLFYALDQDGGSALELDYLAKPVGTRDLARALARHGLEPGGEEERTVLVVDDEPGVLDVHARVVRAQLPRCRVLEACDGCQALDTLRREQVDLVLLDLMMPGVDGFSVLEEMREDQATRDVPVIVLTAQLLTERDMERLNRGVAAVLGKGLFSIEETLRHVERALARQKGLNSETQQVVRRAMACVHEHYREPLSRDGIAAHVGVSKRHLTRCFDEELGLSPIAYLNRYRVKRARELLEKGNRTITEIALDVGFSSNSYFARVFRREMGVSPGVYREQSREQEAGNLPQVRPADH
jgi:signal transduction histidine kinase/AraC-like DNA-binding protein